MKFSGQERLKKGPWDPEEDQRLIAFIKRYGIMNWNLTPKAAGLSRSGKSCRLRWMNYLRPDLKHGRLTVEETKSIIELHESLGNKWSQIAAQLPGRTDNEIKNFYHTHIRKCFRTVRGANRWKSKRTKREEKSFSKIVPTSIIYGAAQESNSQNSSTITESIDEFPIAESYSPSHDSCAIMGEINNMRTISSSESHGEIDDEDFCPERFQIFEDLYLPEIDANMFEELGFAHQLVQKNNPQESTNATNNDELTSFWFNIFVEANSV